MSKSSRQLTITGDLLATHEPGDLAPFAARPDRSRGRRHPEEEHAYRGAYMRDRDRIIHCTAFRRLEYKTQVFVNHEGDYYRTRLTHTMEVAQIARIIARTLRVSEDLTEAIALAHDIGHTPFGHSGEEALKELMQADGGFDHNLHGLRVVDWLERRYPEFPGLNLTWEVRESIAKHHTTHDSPLVPVEFDPSVRPLVEAQIVEVADAVAYDSHDIDDGLKSGLLVEEELEDVAIWRAARDAVVKRYGELETSLRRIQVVRHIINLEVTDVLDEAARRIEAAKPRSEEGVRGLAHNLVAFGAELEEMKRELEKFLMEKLYRHPRVTKMAVKSKRFVADIFNAYAADSRQLPLDYQKRIKEEEEILLTGRTSPAPPDDAEREALRRRAIRRVVCDYVAGMTDRFAQDDYLRLFTPYERL